ncbi:uncharacterized protein V3H82_012169 [Fundulus diaphanus]
MHKLTPERWIQSPGPQVCVRSFHPGRLGLASGVLNHRDDNEAEDEEEFPAVCHHIIGCDDITHQADDAQWFTFGPQAHSETPGLPGSDLSSLHQITGADRAETLQECAGCCCGEGQAIETNTCVGVYGQREGLNHCWSGSPSNYYVVKRNTVVEVEVVEEVAVEDTVELMTEDLYPDALLDVEFMQSEQLYPP